MNIGSRDEKNDALPMGPVRSPRMRKLLRAGRSGFEAEDEAAEDATELAPEEISLEEDDEVATEALLLALDDFFPRSNMRYSGRTPSLSARNAAVKRAISPRVRK